MTHRHTLAADIDGIEYPEDRGIPNADPMTPAQKRTEILVDAARRIDRRTHAIHPHALVYAQAAARQYALPFWTAGDLRREGRRERNSFIQATRTFRAQTDWRQTRGQSADARIRGSLRRSRHFHVAVFAAIHRHEIDSPARVARAASEAAWEEAQPAAA